MNKSEAYAHFLSAEIEPAVSNWADEWLIAAPEKREADKEVFIKGFESLVHELQSKKPEFKVAYIHYSILTTQMLFREPAVFIEAFDTSWLFSEPFYIYCDPSVALIEWYGLIERLCFEAKKYVILSSADVELAILGKTEPICEYFFMVGKTAIERIIFCDEFNSLNKTSDFQINIGRYRSLFKRLYPIVEDESNV